MVMEQNHWVLLPRIDQVSVPASVIRECKEPFQGLRHVLNCFSISRLVKSHIPPFLPPGLPGCPHLKIPPHQLFRVPVERKHAGGQRPLEMFLHRPEVRILQPLNKLPRILIQFLPEGLLQPVPEEKQRQGYPQKDDPNPNDRTHLRTHTTGVFNTKRPG